MKGLLPCRSLAQPGSLLCVVQGERDAGKGLEMRKLVLSGFLASEEIYINQLEALLLVSTAPRLDTPSSDVLQQGWVGGWVDGWMGVWVGGWMDGLMGV